MQSLLPRDTLLRTYLTPVHKKGDLSFVINYRPISLLNFEAKLFEKLVFKYLYNHLQDNNMLSSLHTGFIPMNQLLTNLHIYSTYMYSLKHLMLINGYGLSSAIPAKLLIVYDIKGVFTNLKLLVFLETSSNGFKATSQDAVSV